MLQPALDWIKYWLPLIQGFAALASIGGALLSWKYAFKAQRAREEMTRNVVTSKLISTFELALAQLQDFRHEAVGADGKPDYAAYQSREQQNKKVLEEALAQASASSLYFKVRPKTWDETITHLAQASAKPEPIKVEYACKFLKIITAELKLAAATREIAPNA
jgi:hypothetical protein